MMGWILLVLFAVVLVAVFRFNVGKFKHKLYFTSILLLLCFFIFTFAKVVNASSVDLTSPSGIFSAGKIYLSWLGHAFGNLQVLTGNVVRMDWFGNATG